MYDTVVKVTSPSFSRHPLLQKELLSTFPNAVLNTDGTRFKGQALIDYVKGAEALIIGLEQMTPEVIDACSELKIISKYGVGLNNIDLDYCERQGVKIGWTGGVNRRSVSEMTLGFMLMLSRNLYATANELKSGTWNKSGGFQLSGKTVGIIGLGYIGKDLVRLLEPFNCRILVNDILPQVDFCLEHGLENVPKDEIFREADIITVHTPYTTETARMLNAEVFEVMKPSAIIINTSRGGIVDENDLKVALKGRKIGGAALDTYLEEPPEDGDLISIPNLITTPHIGGNALEAVEAMGMSAINHLRKFYAQQ